MQEVIINNLIISCNSIGVVMNDLNIPIEEFTLAMEEHNAHIMLTDCCEMIYKLWSSSCVNISLRLLLRSKRIICSCGTR